MKGSCAGYYAASDRTAAAWPPASRGEPCMAETAMTELPRARLDGRHAPRNRRLKRSRQALRRGPGRCRRAGQPRGAPGEESRHRGRCDRRRGRQLPPGTARRHRRGRGQSGVRSGGSLGRAGPDPDQQCRRCDDQDGAGACRRGLGHNARHQPQGRLARGRQEFKSVEAERRETLPSFQVSPTPIRMP
jgi:hypothetical protein